MRLATFDIFDTTLIRQCGSPDVIFDLVARKLWPSDEALRTAFLNRRRQAAHTAGSDASLSDIYGCFAADEFAPLSIEVLMNEELDTERRMLTVNPVVRDRIRELRRSGWEIKFLSDMYLSSAFLSEVLMREGCLEDGEEVIVSCEWTARKDNGSLYRLVRKKYNPQEWMHFGDNKRSDIRMARRNGVKGIWIDTRNTPAEMRIASLSTTWRNIYIPKFVAGLMRAVRIQGGNTSDVAIAADYVASLYIPFVVYVLRQCQSKGIRKLHFLSRDGYIMQRIAEALSAPGIELNYLFVSRKALMGAYLAEDTENRYLEIVDRQTLISKHVCNLLNQLGLKRDQLAQEFGITFNYDRILSAAQQKDFIDKIFHNETFTPRLIERFRKNSDLASAYLRQEGLADGEMQAMVDIGWLGTTRLMINSILGFNENKTIPTFYVGIRDDVYSRKYGDYYSYFPQGQLDTSATALIENYFSASPYPSTIGYSRNMTGRIEPVFADGAVYCETSTVRVNVDTACHLARIISPFLTSLSDEMLYLWAKNSISALSSFSDVIDLSPIAAASEFDGIPMIKRLSVTELFSLIFVGGRPTACDRGSLEFTVGNRLAIPLWKLHIMTAKVRSRLYNKFLLKRK